MHNPPVELDAMDDVVGDNQYDLEIAKQSNFILSKFQVLENPEYRVEASCMGHFHILQVNLSILANLCCPAGKR